MEWPEGQEEGTEPPRETGALRSWVMGGTRRFAINPRRRTGRNAQARQLLASDGTKSAAHGGWLGLISALQRHTVHDAMAEMPKEDRHLLTLAFLHGHTNDEIAQMLNVSVRTVSRRLSTALGKLEEHVQTLGIWMLSAVLVVLAQLRLLRDHQAVTIAAAGAAAVVAIGVVASSPAALPARAGLTPSTGHSISAILPAHGATSAAPQSAPVTVLHADNNVAATVKPVKQSKQASTDPDEQKARGCGGNPTDAPPAVPVGPRGAGPHTSPVTHPGKGGCGPHRAD
jgi:hypothetical protein